MADKPPFFKFPFIRVPFSTLSFRVLAICYYYHLGGVESARVLDYHNHLRLKKGNAIEPPYHYIHDDNDDFIFILFFSFNHHRATFYNTTLAPVWSSANRVWFCREWRAARRDAIHVTLATPKAKDPAHLSTCTLHVSLAFSIPTSSSSSIYLVTQSPAPKERKTKKSFAFRKRYRQHSRWKWSVFTSAVTYTHSGNSFSPLLFFRLKQNKRERIKTNGIDFGSVWRSIWLSSSFPWRVWTFQSFPSTKLV